MVQHNTIDHTGLTGVSTVSYASNVNSVAGANTGGAATTVTRGDHVHLGVRSITHASNTFSGPVTFTTEGDLGITSPSTGTLAFKAISGAGGGGGGSVATRTEATLSGDVTLTAAGTYYDGPTITPAAGTYDVWGRVTFFAGGTGNRGFTARLIANASATPIDEAETDAPSGTGNMYQLMLSARVVANGTDPILIRGSSATATVDKMSRNPQSNSPSAINRATLLVIVRVA